MNILFVHQVADRSEASLVEWMSQRGDHVTCICDPRDTRAEDFENAGAHVVTLRIKNRLDLLAIPKIRKLCLNKPIDILYSSFNAGISVSLLATLGLPTQVIAYRGTLGNLSRLDPSSYLTHLSPWLSGIVCNCPPIKDFLTSLGFPDSRVRVVFKGHSERWYLTDSLPTKQDLGIPNDHIVIGLVANIRPLKGVEDLLEAVSPLVAKFPLTVLLVGTDKDDAMKAKVEEMGLSSSVKLLGFRTDAAQLANAFDIACLPSTRREGVPRSIVEAMCHGKPCVVSNVGGLPYLVEHEVNGLVVPPKDPIALRSALTKLIEDQALRERFGQASHRRFRDTFLLQNYHEEMRSFFAEVLTSSASYKTPSVLLKRN